jgi:hypothetical protein
METGLSSNATPVLPCFPVALAALAAVIAVPAAAQDASSVSATPAAEQPPAPRPRLNLMVTVPRGEVNQAELQQCRDNADAGTVSGEIVVCREGGSDGTGLTGSRADSQKRYAQETMNQGRPLTPDFIKDCKDQGNPFGCVGFGKAPPPALMIDVAALPKAPAGSDADRIARGLPPLGHDGDLSEEQEKARREAAGIKTTVPPRGKKKG